MQFRKELFERVQNQQEKYTYYLLSVSASCIGFSLFQSRDMNLSLNEIPLGLSTLLFGISFYLGCKKLFLTSKHLSNSFLLMFDELYPDKEKKAKEFADNIKISSKAITYYQYQFTFIILGGLSYIAWHIWCMYLRS